MPALLSDSQAVTPFSPLPALQLHREGALHISPETLCLGARAAFCPEAVASMWTESFL